jgi:hypothetical protein
LSTNSGASWSGNSANGSVLQASRASPGNACSAGAAEITGTLVENGYDESGEWKAQDLSAYTGLSFAVRARAALYLNGSGGAAAQGANNSCSVDSNGALESSCGVGTARAIAGFTTGDLGAFPSGQTPWSAGALFSETPGACNPPADPGLSFAATPAFPSSPAADPAPTLPSGWGDACPAPDAGGSGMDGGAIDGGHDAGTPVDAGTDAGTSGGAANSSGGGCGSAISSGSLWGALMVALLCTRHRRARC